MKPTLDEQDIAVYASDAQTIQEPYGSDYSQGVRVGRTIPAKWWNWLFRAVTSRLHQGYNDITSMFSELKNLILSAGLTPSSEDNTQVIQSIIVKTDEQLPRYIAQEKERFARRWSNYECYDEQGNSIVISNRTVIGDYFFAKTASLDVARGYSKDNIHWKLTTASSSPNYGDGASFIACFCNGYYIGLADKLTNQGPNTWTHTLYVWAGTTPDNMQPISSTIYLDNWSGTPNALTHVVAGDKVIILSSSRQVVILDTTTLTCTQYTGITCYGTYPFTPYDANADLVQGFSVELPSVIVNGAYVFGGCVSFDGTTLTNLAPDTSGAILIGTHFPRVLRNGNIAFIPTTNNALITISSYVMDSYGNVTVSAYPFLPIYTQAYLNDCVLIKDLGDNSVSFSYDGTNFTKLPFTFDAVNIDPSVSTYNAVSWTSIVQKDNKYFIVPRGESPSFNVLSMREINGSLSGTLDDYFDIEFTMPSNIYAVGYNQVVGGTKVYDYSLRVGGDSELSITENNIELYFGKFIPVMGKYAAVYHAKSLGYMTANKCTGFGVNTVLGNTLYLR